MQWPEQCRPGTERPARLRFAHALGHGPWRISHGYDRVGAELAAQLGLPVDVTAAADYHTLVQMIGRGVIDVAVLPPVAYVRAREQFGCLGLAATLVGDGSAYYSGYLVARRDGPVRTIRDLQGQRIGFVDDLSASGWLFPLRRLLAEGIDPRQHSGRVLFLGDHQAVIKATLAGEVAAGASFPGAIQRARAAGLDVSELRVIGQTGRIPYDAVVVRPGLEVALAERVANVLYGLNASTPQGRAALAPLANIDGFAKSSSEHYSSVVEALARLSDSGVKP
ncbi:MAG: phosphate/phosphite/phosphonate ABC transporter substrate-binding protein [Deltaproteobacteria bacterium]|nr:phosphate/phosphite/phosphonate ABC transporter substrate-binding protein [Deltaproteobacteria bacterium]